MSRPLPLLALALSVAPLAPAQSVSIEQLQNWVSSHNVAALRGLGRPVLPALARLYDSAGDEGLKARIAQSFYELSWKSPEAKRALMKDIHTQNPDLRLQVQWALGRVSNDQDVVDSLLANMRGDANPLFRDKAACALAYDQVHLTEPQKVRLFAALIEALNDDKPDVRAISILALSIHTGQTKGFDANAPVNERRQRIGVWKQWLEEYKSGL